MKKLMLLLILFLPLIAEAQIVPFTKDSIPVVNGKVVFKVEFKADLKKEGFHKRAYDFIVHKLNPYSGKLLKDNDNYTVFKITDYLGILNGLFQKFGMYMTYSLLLGYKDGICTIVIRDIYYMDKGYYETDIDRQRKQAMPKYSAKDIMIDQNYSLLFVKNVSERITDASLKRINEIIKGLDASFGKK